MLLKLHLLSFYAFYFRVTFTMSPTITNKSFFHVQLFAHPRSCSYSINAAKDKNVTTFLNFKKIYNSL